jgi:hypothetical protein
MDSHYEEFKVNLSKIELEFKKLLQSQSSHNPNGLLKKTVDAKVFNLFNIESSHHD